MIIFHILTIIITGLAVLYSDEQGLMWVLGKKEVLSMKLIERLHMFVSVGISLIILTGGLMVIPDVAYYFAKPLFLAKMGFVLILILNGFFIGVLSRIATTRTFASLSNTERLPLMVSGVASILGWAGAVILGFTIGG